VQTTEDRLDDAGLRTLRELLYVDASKDLVAEEEWLALVRGAGAGDQAALQALFERTHRLVFTLITRIAGDSSVAEHLTLELYADIWRQASRYDPAAQSVLGWLASEARTRALEGKAS